MIMVSIYSFTQMILWQITDFRIVLMQLFTADNKFLKQTDPKLADEVYNFEYVAVK